MRVLLTGGSGFVGGHILDLLRTRGVATVLFLRPASARRFEELKLPLMDVRAGSLDEPERLREAMHGVTHVIHCAGAVKALRDADFYEANQLGTRHLVTAVNQAGDQVSRMVQISSLAAAGPATAETPSVEESTAHPVSEYGKSKLAGEEEVKGGCRCEYVILRPPSVYGPRDTEFLRLFKAVQAHIRPEFGFGRQQLSMVFAPDLAEAAFACLTHSAAAGRTYNVAAPEVVTAGALAARIAQRMGVWAIRVPLPTVAFWSACAIQQGVSSLTRKANVLSLQKYPELSAPGWVCDPTRLRKEMGFVCRTSLTEGIDATLASYRELGWL